MQVIRSDIKEKVLQAMDTYDYDALYRSRCGAGTFHESCSIEDFKALLSPAAAPYLEQMARKAEELQKSFRKYGLYFYTVIYCELLPELLHLLWI